MNKENHQVASKLIKITLLSLLFMAVELVGGYLAHSIAIWSDAFHLLSDVLAYAISLAAVLLTERKSPQNLTFGWVKAQTLGALFNVIFIYIVTIQLFIEATHRMIKKDKVEEPVYMLITSIFGLICNLIVLTILHNDPNGGHHGCSHHHDHHLHQQGHSHQHHHDHNDGKPCSSNHLALVDIPKSNSQFTKNETKNSHQLSEYKHNHEHERKHDHKDCCGGSEKKRKQQNEGQRDSGDEIAPDSAKGLKKDQLLMECQILPSIGSDEEISSNQVPHEGKMKNINLEAAYIHIITDIILSIGVIIAALIIYFFAPEGVEWSVWYLADPLCTYLFSFLAIYSTWPIFKESLLILLDGCQDPRLLEQIEVELKKLADLKSVVDLKVWSLNRGKHYAVIRVRMSRQSGKQRVKKIFTSRGIQCFLDCQQEEKSLSQ